MRLADAAAPSLQKSVSDVFGFAADDKPSAGRQTADAFLRCPDSAVVVDKQRTRGRHRTRALWAAVGALRKSLPRYVADAEVAICSAVTDDATMWCRTPAGTADATAERLRGLRRVRVAAAAGRACRRPRKVGIATGKNKATTCVRVVQHLFVKRRGRSSLFAAEVPSPCIAVPRANWHTLQSRKHRWCVWKGNGVGMHLRGEASDVDSTFDAIPAIVMISTNDVANTNTNVRAVEERNCLQATQPGHRWRVHCDVHCLGHQIVLPTRAASACTGDLASILVRLGHVLSTAFQVKRFLEACDSEIDAFYVHKFVMSLPDDSAYVEARLRFKRFLDATMVAMDMDQGDIDSLFEFFNGDPETMEITHLCTPRCRSGCTSAADGCARAKGFCRLALGTGPVLALEYRWKGMERAAGWFGRARAVHDILARALRRLYTAESIIKAQELVDSASNVQDLSF